MPSLTFGNRAMTVDLQLTGKHTVVLLKRCFYHKRYRNSILSPPLESHYAMLHVLPFILLSESLPPPVFSQSIISSSSPTYVTTLLHTFLNTVSFHPNWLVSHNFEVKSEGKGLHLFALHSTTIVNLCIICDPVPLLISSVCLIYESITFFHSTICVGLSTVLRGLGCQENPGPRGRLHILHCDVIVLAQAPRRHMQAHGKTTFTGLRSFSDTIAVTRLMPAHFRSCEKRGGIPFEAGSSGMRKSGLR